MYAWDTHRSAHSVNFCPTVFKTVSPTLWDRCLSVCPVCNVGVLWPNGWMDQDETWYGGRPRPWPQCVRWGPSSPFPKGTQPPIFGPCLLWSNDRLSQLLLSFCSITCSLLYCLLYFLLCSFPPSPSILYPGGGLKTLKHI